MPSDERYEPVEESDIENSKEPSTQPSRHHRFRHKSRFGWARYKVSKIYRSSWWFLFDGFITLAFLWLLFDKQLPARIKKQGTQIQASSDLPSVDIAGDLTHFAPSFHKRVTVFSQQPYFVPNHTRAASLDHAKGHWASLIPAGGGLVGVGQQAKDKFKHISLIDGDKAGVSAVHSLQCLFSIMVQYGQLVRGESVSVPDPHMDYCFDHLRQQITCHGDTALLGEDEIRKTHEVTESKVQHVCKDWNEVYNWMEKNRASDELIWGESEDD
ncbi:uncharacterized protein RAG0_14713 [Rhynchosporium agropyri]|uniref:Uncharacterized protein n=1 Tax=Rhynchosporium agropyri TaxID=914238 RepID=A0A1E1LI32_9HELO|nr:uncharacterized protein RAG0_14713 [Rhynchosporium agropyri]